MDMTEVKEIDEMNKDLIEKDDEGNPIPAELHGPNRQWMMATVTALLFNILILFQYGGIAVLLVTVVAGYTVYEMKKQSNLVLGRSFYLIAGYMALVSIVFSVTTVSTVRFFAGLILWILLGILPSCGTTFRWPRWLLNILSDLLGAFVQSGAYYRIKGVGNEGRQKKVAQVLLGLVIAVPILAVALSLLTSADAVFGDMLDDGFTGIQRFFEDFEAFEPGKVIWRLVMFFLMAPTLYGLGIFLKKKKSANSPEPIVHEEVKKHMFIAPTVSGTVLVVLNAVYLLFAYVQIRFLFIADIDVMTYDYASYAREGFFELVALSVLNTLGILFINGFTKPHTFNRVSLSVTAMCTYIMIASSTYKMYLYESEYGYTQLRLYVYFILAFMAVFMALIGLNIWKPAYRVIEWAIVIGLCYFMVLSFVNVDAVIVRKNIERYEEKHEQADSLDLRYLTTLSEDAVPELVKFVEGQNINDWSDGTAKSYQRMLENVIENHEERSFFEWNYRHQRAYEAAKGALDW